jgi:hypothetical protein
MLNVRNILVALLCVSPVLLLWDGRVAQGIVAAVAAVGLAMTAISLRPVETEFLVSVTRASLTAAAVPVVWIVLQILPLGIFAHPIWKSAATGLHQPILGSITIDPALSLMSLGYYLTLIAIAFLSAAVAVDRHRAEWILFALTGAATITGLFVIGWHFFPLASWFPAFQFAQAIDCVSLGTMVTVTNCIRAVERYEMRNARQIKPPKLSFALSLTALAISLLAFALLAEQQIVFATAYGLLALGCQLIIRRFGLGSWGVAGMAIPALGIAAILVTSHPSQREASAPLAFAGGSSPARIELNQRVLNDAPLVGTGAGTFPALAPIYREKDDPPSASVPATTASALAIELGKPASWLILAGTAGFIVILLRASLRRGRDSFYAAMAGGTLLATALLAFTNAGQLGISPGLIVAAIVGLGIGQSESRTIRL